MQQSGNWEQFLNYPIIQLPNSVLAGLCGLYHGLAARCHLALHVLEPIASLLRAINQLLDVCKHARVVHLSAQFRKKWLYLGKNKEHLTAKTGIQDEFLMNRSREGERCNHAPVSPDLAQPVVFLGAQGRCNFHEVIDAFGPESYQPPVARLTQFGFAAQVVKFNDELSVCSSRLFRHKTPPEKFGLCWEIGPISLYGIGRSLIRGNFGPGNLSISSITSAALPDGRGLDGRSSLILTLFVWASNDRT